MLLSKARRRPLQLSVLHLASYYALIGRLFCQFGGQQGMLGRVGLPGFWDEEAHFLVGPSPLGVELTVVAERHQRPQDVDGEEGDGEGDEAHRLQPAAQVEVVLSPLQAQPARDGCERGDEQEAHHVAEERPLLVARARVPQPLGEGPGPALDAELGVAELAVAGVGGREPLLQAAPVHRAQRARAVARRQQALAAAALVANAADGAVALRAHWFEDRREQVSVHGRDLSDVECRTPVATAAAAAAALLHALPQAGAARTVTQGTGQVATAPRCHGYGGLRSRRCSGS